MKIMSFNQEQLALQMHPHEAFILRQVVGLCDSGFGIQSNYSSFIPSVMSQVQLRALWDKLRSQIPKCELEYLAWGNPEYEIKNPVPIDEYVLINLSPIEWTTCFFTLVFSVFGCIISENDLASLTLCSHREVKLVIDALQKEIEEHVYKIATEIQRELKHSRKQGQ